MPISLPKSLLSRLRPGRTIEVPTIDEVGLPNDGVYTTTTITSIALGANAQAQFDQADPYNGEDVPFEVTFQDGNVSLPLGLYMVKLSVVGPGEMIAVMAGENYGAATYDDSTYQVNGTTILGSPGVPLSFGDFGVMVYNQSDGALEMVSVTVYIYQLSSALAGVD